MRKLFESFRKYSLLTEDQLLVEGRKQDAAKRYPGLAKKREELDGESLLDVLIDKDPSGNQKYLMSAARLLQRSIEMAEQNDGYSPFYGKQWPEDADDNLYSPWGVANNIANSAGVDEQPLFVPTPLQSNNQQPAGSASSASPGWGFSSGPRATS